MNTIATRLNIGFAAGWILLLSVFAVTVSLSFRSLSEFYVLSRLQHDAENLLGALVSGPSGLTLKRVNPVFEQPFSGHYFAIRSPQGELSSRSAWDWTFPRQPDLAPGAELVGRMEGPEQQKLLVRTAAYRKAGIPLQISVAENVSDVDKQLLRLQLYLLLAGLVMLVIMLVWQRGVVRRGFRPVQKAVAELTEIEQGRRRALSEQVPVEIWPFVRRLNRLFGELQQRIQRSRRAMGNLAHALKTPLSRLYQLSNEAAIARDPRLQEEVQQALGRIGALIDSELKRARLVGTTLLQGRTELKPLLEGLIDVLNKIYRDQALDFELRVMPGAVLHADPEDMAELLGNLLDNAAKWAAGRVLVSVEQTTPGWLRIRVADNGPGVDETLQDRLFQRGVRLDERQTPGHGLGLAIVKEIIDQYGARIEARRSSELGGLQVCVEFPGHMS